MFKIEQLNIVGKRSGNGFVAHKATLVNALSQALSERVTLNDFTIGRKGFLGYLKALSGSNIVKIVPDSGSASESQAIGKKLKVTCGSHVGYLTDSAWIGDKAPMTICEVRVSPIRVVKPNLGGLELSEALNRVLPFTAKEDNKPILQCVLFRAKEGKLTLASADGYRLAVVKLNYDGEGEALISRDELRGIATSIRKAHRVALSFEKKAETLDGMSLVVDTELIRYKWLGVDGHFPEYEKLIPATANTTAHLDTIETARALASLKAVANEKDYAVDIHLNGGIVLSNTDEAGQVTIPADIEGGENRVRLKGDNLSEALRACGGMVDFSLTDGKSPVLFTIEGYQLVVMPLLVGNSQPTNSEPAESQVPDGATDEAFPAAEQETAETEKAEAVAEAEKVIKTNKPKRKHKAKEPVAVA